MSKWTRANPLAAVSGYGVPAGHFANGYTNGGDRVAMRAGGRIGFKKGLIRTGFKMLLNQLRNVELKESVHRLQKKVALDELKR